MKSNLPPGSSSPDGGIDHAMEKAIDELVEALPNVEVAKLLRLVIPVVEHIYQLGYNQGVMNGPTELRVVSSPVEDYLNKSKGE